MHVVEKWNCTDKEGVTKEAISSIVKSIILKTAAMMTGKYYSEKNILLCPLKKLESAMFIFISLAIKEHAAFKDPHEAEERRSLIRQNKKLLNQLYESAKKIEMLELTKLEMKEQLELLDFQMVEIENQKAMQFEVKSKKNFDGSQFVKMTQLKLRYVVFE
ncbi:hypothetical protein ACTXT7_014607 [Hymenolepis weldensis]